MALKDEIKTITDIRAKEPCYDPGALIPESWTGTVMDILGFVGAPLKDRIWTSAIFMNEKEKRRFALLTLEAARGESQVSGAEFDQTTALLEAYMLDLAPLADLINFRGTVIPFCKAVWDAGNPDALLYDCLHWILHADEDMVFKNVYLNSEPYIGFDVIGGILNTILLGHP